MAVAGKLGAVYAPANTTGTSVSGETFSGDGTTTTFTLVNEYVKPESETITVDGTGQDEPGDYKINYVTGEINFDTAPASGTDNISVDYTYYSMTQVGGFFDWSIDESADLLEDTEFGDTHRSYLTGLLEWTASATKYFGSDQRFNDYFGDYLVFSFYVDDSSGVNKRFEGWGLMETKTTDVAVDSLVEESIDFQGTGELVYRTG